MTYENERQAVEILTFDIDERFQEFKYMQKAYKKAVERLLPVAHTLLEEGQADPRLYDLVDIATDILHGIKRAGKKLRVAPFAKIRVQDRKFKDYLGAAMGAENVLTDCVTQLLKGIEMTYSDLRTLDGTEATSDLKATMKATDGLSYLLNAGGSFLDRGYLQAFEEIRGTFQSLDHAITALDMDLGDEDF